MRTQAMRLMRVDVRDVWLVLDMAVVGWMRALADVLMPFGQT